MSFNIHQKVTDPATGEYDERASGAYRDAIIELFAQSPEGEAHEQQGQEIGWTSIFIDYAMSYLGTTPPKMGVHDLDEVLFGLFPRKVAVGANEAGEIVAELRAFWSFLGRAYALANAPAMLRRLDAGAERRLEHELANPANFGMAKSMVMQGQARGFDTSTPEGVDAWFRTYNAEVGMHPPLATLGEIGMLGEPGPLHLPPAAQQHGGGKSSKEKSRRKMAKASRKQNRRK